MSKLGNRLDVEYIRSDFPVLKQKVNGYPLVYFDNGASSQKPQVVIDTITNFYSTYYSNVHRAVHSLSQQATKAYEACREKVQKLINAASSDEIIYTSGTTEAVNIVARSFGDRYLKAGDEIILSTMEHHANIVPWQMLCERTGARIKVLPLKASGEWDMKVLKDIISERTKLIASVHVSNVMGTINPVKELTQLAKANGTTVFIDGAQAVPHMKVDVQDLDVDFYTFSAHKMFGPTGAGALYGKKKWLQEMPPYHGGGAMIDKVTFEKTTYNDVPHKFEAGTPNIAGFIGFAAAIDYMNRIGIDVIESYEKELAAYFLPKLNSVKGLTLLGKSNDRASVFSFVLDGCHPLDVGTLLNEYGIAVRTGHHCCQPLMQHYKVPASIRASLSFYNTFAEIDFFTEKLLKVLKVLK